ncbi:MAG: glycosyltransferase family 4 protein [Ruminococcaceae bacterium]|nr:glycosyltransferase family 4 protein [Oscillospiraceae bacterium]
MRILYVSTLSLTVNSFFKSHIGMLREAGAEVDIACNCKELELDGFFAELGCRHHPVDFSRRPFSFDNLKAYKQLKSLMEKERYDVVHCHTPNASVITRLVCRRLRKNTGLKVFYTAHGFHFHKGSPKLNWMLYYPVEKLCSRFTDKLITVNKEDYGLAKAKFKAKEVCYVPGVGVDVEGFEKLRVDRRSKRRELGVPEDAFLLLSVGELNKNKNHRLVIEAVARMGDPRLHYMIAGTGENRDGLLALAKELGVSDKVHLLGYRTDIAQLNHCADVFCFPSFREGLGIAAIEAMACALPLITSDVHGINDYSIDGVTGYKFSPKSVDEFAEALNKLRSADEKLMGRIREYNVSASKRYSVCEVLKEMKKIYKI